MLVIESRVSDIITLLWFVDELLLMVMFPVLSLRYSKRVLPAEFLMCYLLQS